MSLKLSVTTTPPFRDQRGRFTRASNALQSSLRDSMRSQGRVLTNIVKQQLAAKIGERNAKLEKGIRFNTRQQGSKTRLNVTVPQKARPHKIYPKNAKALAFGMGGIRVVVPKGGGFASHYRDGGKTLWSGKGFVNHPGGSLQPLFTPVLNTSLKKWQSGNEPRVISSAVRSFEAEIGK